MAAIPVRKLPAGCNLSYSIASGKLQVKRYWQFTLEPAEENLRQDSIDELLSLLKAAVDRRLIADVPVGTFLSGGIDSSLISAMAAERVGAGELKTFSIGFSEASFDESNHARFAAQHIGTEHFDEILEVDTLLSHVDEIRNALGEPLADSSIIPTWLVSKIARERVTVTLGGDGADELFAGYSPFKALKWASILNAVLPGKALQLARSTVNLLPVSHGYMSFDFKLKRALAGLAKPERFWVPTWMAPVDPLDVNRLVHDGTDHRIEEIYSEVVSTWETCEQSDPVSRALQFFTDLYLQDDILSKLDRASMMNSLEARSPFLDIEVVDFVRRLPNSQKFHGGVTKRLLRDAAARYLPSSIIDRRKQGFAVPVGRWFRDRALSINLDKLPNYIDHTEVTRRVERHVSGASDERLFLWAALMLEHSG